jgi:hypothetical protein
VTNQHWALMDGTERHARASPSSITERLVNPHQTAVSSQGLPLRPRVDRRDRALRRRLQPFVWTKKAEQSLSKPIQRQDPSERGSVIRPGVCFRLDSVLSLVAAGRAEMSVRVGHAAGRAASGSLVVVLAGGRVSRAPGGLVGV